MECVMTEGSGVSLPPQGPLRKSRNDSLNRPGAMALARQLERYWRERGYDEVRFWAEPIVERFEKIGTHEIYCVRCNLKNGLPPTHPNNRN